MAAVMQVASRPLPHNYAAASGDLRHDRAEQQHVWAKAIHRAAADASAPSRRSKRRSRGIKQILSN
jgi:hypothetical protein